MIATGFMDDSRRMPNTASDQTQPRLRIGFLLAPRFTLSAFATFVDVLRLAADDGDGSRPIRCSWKVISTDMAPVQASCCARIEPDERLGDPARFDVDALQHRSFSGRVQSFSPATASEFSILPATNATGNFTKVAQRLPVRISIDPDQDMAEFLEPGLSVVVTVDPGQGDGIAQTGAAVMGPRG